MNYYFRFLILFFFINILKSNSQFKFTGIVNDDYLDATAYLSIVDNCNKKDLLLTESILQECRINNGEFEFKGDFLEKTNQIYKIHIDNCKEQINNFKHLLNHCEDSKEIIFIANNNDSIHFPLNNLSQIFCDIDQSNSVNSAILLIENLQETILNDLQNTINDRQRNKIYQKHFKKLQSFSQQFNEPLAELYAYHLYANENAISRDYYLTDLKKSNYYNDLLNRLKKSYINSPYYELYKIHLIKDQYPSLKNKSTTYKYIVIILSLLLIVSLIINYFLIKKNKPESASKDYKELLTPQEINVFELMQNHSNKEIGDKLFISVSTVKTHINNIYSKLSIRSRKELKRFL